MRNKKGQFMKGVSANPNTQFKKGTHWRKRQLFWDKDWLYNEYIELSISSFDIAKRFNVADSTILFWLKKHDIKRRSTSEARDKKYWGLSGSDNPMWNKRGELNPRWLGGITAERQAFYTSREWKNVSSVVWKRDKGTCQRCKLRKDEQPDVSYHIHHIVSFKDVELRAEASNLVLVCETCHLFIHSRKNINGDFLSKI